MTYLRKIYAYLSWCLSPSCGQLARYSFELSRGLVLATFAYIFFTDSSLYTTVIITLATALGLMFIGIMLTRLEQSIELRKNENETDQ